MKRFILIGIIALGILFPGIKILAQESNIKSKGNIDGIVNFYSEDISYLENEINVLLEECKEDSNYE